MTSVYIGITKVTLGNVKPEVIEEALARSVQTKNAVLQLATEISSVAGDIAMNEFVGHGNPNQSDYVPYREDFGTRVVNKATLSNSQNNFIHKILQGKVPAIFAIAFNGKKTANVLEWGSFAIQPKLIMTRAAQTVANKHGYNVDLLPVRAPEGGKRGRGKAK